MTSADSAIVFIVGGDTRTCACDSEPHGCSFCAESFAAQRDFCRTNNESHASIELGDR
jgi:hypothetical protein